MFPSVLLNFLAKKICLVVDEADNQFITNQQILLRNFITRIKQLTLFAEGAPLGVIGGAILQRIFVSFPTLSQDVIRHNKQAILN